MANANEERVYTVHVGVYPEESGACFYCKRPAISKQYRIMKVLDPDGHPVRDKVILAEALDRITKAFLAGRKLCIWAAPEDVSEEKEDEPKQALQPKRLSDNADLEELFGKEQGARDADVPPKSDQTNGQCLDHYADDSAKVFMEQRVEYA